MSTPIRLGRWILLAVLLATLALPAAAQTPPTSFNYYWTPSNTGLADLSVRALARDPVDTATLYVQTWEGISKSVDNGRSWTRVNDSPAGTALVVDPNDNATVYATGYLRGVVKTTDGGVTWSQKNQGFPNYNYPRTIAVAPTTPNTVYAGLHDVYSGAPPGGVYRSTDGAETWSYLGLEDEAVYTILVHPTNPNLLYVGGWHGLFISYDGGDHWTERHPDLPIYVSAIAMDPRDPSTMYVGTWDDGIYKSVDLGETWFILDEDGSPSRHLATFQLTVDPAWPYPIYVAAAQGVYGSLDGGASWRNLNASGYYMGVVLDPDEPGRGLLVGENLSNLGIRRGLRLDARQFLPLMMKQNTVAGVHVKLRQG